MYVVHCTTLAWSTSRLVDHFFLKTRVLKYGHDHGRWKPCFQKSDLRVADLIVEQLSNGALRLGRDLLRLVADVQLGDLA